MFNYVSLHHTGLTSSPPLWPPHTHTSIHTQTLTHTILRRVLATLQKPIQRLLCLRVIYVLFVFRQRRYFFKSSPEVYHSYLSAPIQVSVSEFKYPDFCLFFQLNEKVGPSLMTTVAMPVFSTKNETVCGFTVIADNFWYLINLKGYCSIKVSAKVVGFFWLVLNLFMQKNQGILLGVVGTDIPLPELMKLIPKHMVQSAVLMFLNNYINLLFLKFLPCVFGVCSSGSTAMHLPSQTMATSWHTLTSDLW